MTAFTRSPVTRFIGLLGLEALLLVGLLVTAHWNAFSAKQMVAWAIGAHLPYFLLLLALRRTQHLFLSVAVIIGASLALRLICVAAPPRLSDDLYRYSWDGRVLLNGHNPYRHAPDAEELAPLRDAAWRQINHPTLRTIYPPICQVTFAAIAAATPRPFGFKLVSALFDTAVVWLVILLAAAYIEKKGSSPAAPDPTALLAGAAYGLNPLMCIESGMSGHIDPLALLLTLGALLWLMRGNTLRAGLLLGVAVSTKLIPLLLLPVFARRDRRAWVVVPLVAAALYLPFIGAGQALFESLDVFARRWEGNAGLFAVIKSGFQWVIGWASGASAANDMVHLPILDGLAGALQGSFFSLHKEGGFDPAAPGKFALNDLSLACTKLLFALIGIGVIGWVTIRRYDPLRAAAWIFGTLILTTPVLHPWYIAWILPFAILRRHWPWLILAATLPLAYLPLEQWWAAQIWQAQAWIPLVEYGLFAAATAVYLYSKRNASTSSQPNIS